MTKNELSSFMEELGQLLTRHEVTLEARSNSCGESSVEIRHWSGWPVVATIVTEATTEGRVVVEEIDI
jgi:hypothetical protein